MLTGSCSVLHLHNKSEIDFSHHREYESSNKKPFWSSLTKGLFFIYGHDFWVALAISWV